MSNGPVGILMSKGQVTKPHSESAKLTVRSGVPTHWNVATEGFMVKLRELFLKALSTLSDISDTSSTLPQRTKGLSLMEIVGWLRLSKLQTRALRSLVRLTLLLLLLSTVKVKT